tara:strand:- start:2162 stop:2929 length:768 start_codon:yes stop_codon:yes gene_type:complete
MIKLLNNETFEKKDILQKMYDDSFYYGYLGKHALSSSTCKSLLESPEAYVEYINKPPKEKEPQPFRDGRLIHLLSLEPHRIEELTIIESTKGSKAYKLAVEEQLPQTVYTLAELNRCKKVADSVLNNKEFSGMVEDAEFEIPEIGNYNGFPFRGKADILLNGIVVDLKTTSDINSFYESANTYNYDLQAALYLELFGAFEFRYVVVDKKTLEVQVIQFDDEFIQSGYNKLNIATENYQKYIDNKEFYDLNYTNNV